MVTPLEFVEVVEIFDRFLAKHERKEARGI